jgi:hypothetical protein
VWCSRNARVTIVFRLVAATALNGDNTVIGRAALDVKVVEMAVFALAGLVSGRVTVHATLVGKDFHHGIEGGWGRRLGGKGNQCDERK